MQRLERVLLIAMLWICRPACGLIGRHNHKPLRRNESRISYPPAGAVKAHQRVNVFSPPVAKMDKPGSFSSFPSTTRASYPIHRHDKFDLVVSEHFEEEEVSAVVYKHRCSGATVVSVHADDPVNVFTIGFKTPPADHKGIPHILEHSVLSGSRKYPATETFKEADKGSLNCFLNAMTAEASTFYPLASTNEKDFNNLVDVYLDAVWFPNCIKADKIIEQEGCHIEAMQATTEPNLKFNGIVYNEMKGAYGNSRVYLSRATIENMLPQTSFRFDSGGKPHAVRTATFEDLKHFYYRHYTPSNSISYIYGKGDIHQLLHTIDQFITDVITERKNMTSKQHSAEILWGNPIAKLVESKFPVAVGEGKNRDIVTMNWLLNHGEELPPYDRLAMQFVTTLLVGRMTSVMQKALLDSGLGVTVLGYDADIGSQSIYVLGIEDVKNDINNRQAVEDVIMETLQKCSIDGFFDKELVEAEFHTAELRIRAHRAAAMRGLSNGFSIIANWATDSKDLLKCFRMERLLEQIKMDYHSGKLSFEKYVREKLLANSERFSLHMRPDENMLANQEKQEKKELVDLQANLTIAEMTKISQFPQDMENFLAKTNTPEALEKIPRLERSDLNPEPRVIPIELKHIEGVPVLGTPTPTGGLVHATLVIDASAFPFEDVRYLPLWEELYNRGHTTDLKEEDLKRDISLSTGGITVDFVLERMYNPRNGHFVNGEFRTFFRISSSCLVEDVPKMLEKMLRHFVQVQLADKNAAMTFLKQSKADLESSISGDSLSFARARNSAKAEGPSGSLAELTQGVSQLMHIRKLLAEVEEGNEQDWQRAIKTPVDRLTEYFRRGGVEAATNTSDISKRKYLLSLTAPKTDLKILMDDQEHSHSPLKKFLSSLDVVASKGIESAVEVPRGERRHRWMDEKNADADLSLPFHKREAIIVPNRVNYVALRGDVGNDEKTKTTSRGAAAVVTSYIDDGYMWDQLRTKNGAYGGGASYNIFSNALVLNSFRDPHLLETVKIFEELPEFLAKNPSVSEADITRSIIKAFQVRDVPMSPDDMGSRNLVDYLCGTSDEIRRKTRKELLATTEADFQSMAATLKEMFQKDDGSYVTAVASESAVEAANAQIVDPQDKFVPVHIFEKQKDI